MKTLRTWIADLLEKAAGGIRPQGGVGPPPVK